MVGQNSTDEPADDAEFLLGIATPPTVLDGFAPDHASISQLGHVVADNGDEDSNEDSDDDLASDRSHLSPANPISPSIDAFAGKQHHPPATDFSANAARLMKPLPDYQVLDQTHFVWELRDWKPIPGEKLRLPRYTCGNFQWNILLIISNNGHNSVSVYIEPHPVGTEGDKDPDWYTCAQFALDMWNPSHPEAHLPSASSHRFLAHDTDWGFTEISTVRQLMSPANPRLAGIEIPVLENHLLNITAYVKVIDDSPTGVLWHSMMDYDSKKMTGYVGLNNQGATCYLNLLLQSYFTTKVFRNLVYQIPTDDDTPGGAVALALQRIFYLLSTSADPVVTNDLTNSFGWESSDAFTQHDVQELNRVLMDRLETAMKGLPINLRLNDIFVGKMKSFIKCVNVKYELSRVEDFWDIQLNVKGCTTLEESFQKYIETEMLDGENKYQAGDLGYQDAKKGVVFELFPPVLHLQLKRFEYDFMVDDLVKIDDFYEFPETIDLSPYVDSEADGPKLDYKYRLHGVLVHQGSISNGHYYAMIKPDQDSPWLRFDDDKVWKVTHSQVFDENFGADEISELEYSRLSRADQQENLVRRVTSAYMLVYYRELDLDTVLPRVDPPIPERIAQQIKREADDQLEAARAKQEALHYMTCKLITSSTFRANSGFDLLLDVTSSKTYDESLAGTEAEPVALRVKKDDPFAVLYSLVAKTLGYSEEEFSALPNLQWPFRLVAVNHRHNGSNRCDLPVQSSISEMKTNQVFHKLFNRKYDEMTFYVEEAAKELHAAVDSVLDRHVAVVSPSEFEWGSVQSKIEASPRRQDCDMPGIEEGAAHILLFLKYFDPISQQIRGLTHVVVNKSDSLETLLDPVSDLLGFARSTGYELYEELSFTKLELLKSSESFDSSELHNGDIIIVQASNAREVAASFCGRFGDAAAYYLFLLTRIHIQAHPYKACDDERSNSVGSVDPDEGLAAQPTKLFDSWVLSLISCHEFAQELANELDGVDAEYLRICAVSPAGTRHPLKSEHQLCQLVSRHAPLNQIFTFDYEVLPIKLKEFENLKSVKVYWMNGLLQYQLHEILVSRDGKVSELISKLLTKLNVPIKNHKHILMWLGRNHSYDNLIRFEDSVDVLVEGSDFYTGVFPVEVEILSSHDMIKRYDTSLPVDVDELEEDYIKSEFALAQQSHDILNLMPAFHFYKSTSYQHGIPFVMAIYPQELIGETKERLRRKLGLGIQAFEKIKLALADSSGKGNYIDTDKDDLILFEEISKRPLQVLFALDHPDRGPKRQQQLDKGISIK